MCLNAGTKLTKTGKKPEYGWKAFEIHGKDLCFPCYAHQGSMRVPLGRWLTAKKCSILYAGSQDRYDTGFHVFKTRKGAYDWGYGVCDDPHVLVRVKIKGVQMHGTQGDHVVYIADKMLVPRPAKRRK